MKKKLFPWLLMMVFTLPLWAQNQNSSFKAYLENDEYQVYLRINLYDNNIEIPGQDLYGQLPGYLGKHNNSFCWIITSCEVKNEHVAELQLINDFGSEDLKATLTRENDTLYVLRQGAGSTLKVPHQGKWRKLPKSLTLTRRRTKIN